MHCSKQPAAVALKGHQGSSFSVSTTEETTCSQNLCGAENVSKTETQQTFVNGLLGFITLGIYTPLEARVYCSQ